jgi:hypothetical protein
MNCTLNDSIILQEIALAARFTGKALLQSLPRAPGAT